MSDQRPWAERMPDDQFERMRRILAAPSPVGFEAAMTEGVLREMADEFSLDGWALHRYKSNASLVLDTAPGRDDMLTVMVIGHADKIRMQVRSIGEDGKIWINSDSFLPCTLLGHEVLLFSQHPDNPGQLRVIEGGTVEALGAIHFAPPELRAGKKGIEKEMLYLELQTVGDNRREQVKALGIQAGDPIILKRPIRRAFTPNTFYGAYLDNGLGCFVTIELARLIANHGGLKNVRVLFTFATHEEIGRMGSRVLAGVHNPDIVIGVDVNHDYNSAPGVKKRNLQHLEMGKGFTLGHGATMNAYLNTLIEAAAREHQIPFMRDTLGRDSGTDAMAPVFAAVDAAAATIGFPIRNMHTISETGHTGDVLAATHVLERWLQWIDTMNGGKGLSADDLRSNHPRLDLA